MRLLNNSHKRLTAAALVTGALTIASLIGPFSDRTFYCFLVAFIGFSVLAIKAANRQVDQIFDDELDDIDWDDLADSDPLNQNLIPKNHKPTDTGDETR